MPNEMEEVAKEAGCEYAYPFSQVKLLESNPQVKSAVDDPSGICWGLSFVWMEYKVSKSYERFLADLGDVAHSAAMLKAAGLYRIVQAKPDRIAQAAATCGLTPCTNDEGNVKTKDGMVAADMEGEMRGLADWLGAAMGNRYFLVETGKHAMAASGSKLGQLEFFDPNFGMVTCRSANTMATFFHKYFNKDRIKQAYWSTGRRELTLTKFKS